MVSLTAGANKLVAISGVDDAPGDANEPSARRNVVVPPGNPGIARIEACPGVVHASSPSRPSNPAPPHLRAPSPHLRHRYRQIQTLKRPLHQQGRCSRYYPYFPCCRYSLSPQRVLSLQATHLVHPHHTTPEALHLLHPRLFQESLECLEFLEGQQTPPIHPAHPPHLTHK